MMIASDHCNCSILPTNADHMPLAQVDVMSLWLSFSSIMLAFVFVFGNSIRNMYEAVIFLFVMHPLDVGDVLMGQDGSWLQVRRQRYADTFYGSILACGGLVKQSGERIGNTAIVQHALACMQGVGLTWPQVEEMALQNLTLRRSDGVRIYYPIAKLCTEPIFNVTRSALRWEGFKVDTPPCLSSHKGLTLTSSAADNNGLSCNGII